jgi:thiamine transport system substrate-binding protein
MKAKLICCIILLSLLTACTVKPTQKTLTIMTHDSFAVSDSVVKAFESKNNVKLVFLKSGDVGSALNRAILTKGSPQADVFYGVDNTFLSRAVKEGVFEPYASPLLSEVDESFKTNLSGVVTPVDYGDVCINYDKAFFTSHNLAVPTSLDDLLKPEYGKSETGAGMLVVENPATSSPGLAFLFTTIANYGEDGYLNYWRALKENGVVVVNDWDTAYYTNFSASSGKGLQPMVVSYASSPAAEVIYASSPLTESPTASITAPKTCYRQEEYVGILKGTKNQAMAQKFVDFMLDVQFQEDMPLQMLVYPVNKNAAISPEFEKFAQIASDPASLDPQLISEKRDQWIKDWSEVMLH